MPGAAGCQTPPCASGSRPGGTASDGKIAVKSTLQKPGGASYIAAMAHNNGMVPRSKKTRAPKGMSDNAAKFQAAVDKMPLAAGTVAPAEDAIDPAYITVPI